MKRSRPGAEDYTIGWICALPIERAAAEQILDEEYEDYNDGNPYTLGRIAEHHVVIACLPAGQIGLASAAVIATRMQSIFSSIRFGLMVGLREDRSGWAAHADRLPQCTATSSTGSACEATDEPP